MSIKQFLGMAESFCSTLNIHHGIEEEHVFPVYAVRALAELLRLTLAADAG
jgi:hypothetical protein